ncbi:hypothetical protein [Actinomadura sp. 9N215]|uniref:hypothetical protein n=1 Tax=Actinomadura sp. 9N215 TaxID=3375150 RepID=UPI0037BA5174
MTLTTTPAAAVTADAVPVAPSPVPSSGRDRRSCGSAGPAVQQHWGTPVAFAPMDPAGLLSPSAAEIGGAGPALETVPPGGIIADLETAADRFRAAFEALTTAYEPEITPPVGDVGVEVQIWRHGYDRAPARHRADLVAWWVLDATPGPAHTGSGAIAFADPRAGSPMAPMPGRPWGRHLLIRPVPGTLVAVPGWLVSSVVPLERGQHVLVAIASSCR